jgi:hypothetical protein
MGRKRPIELKLRVSQEEANLLQHKLAEAGMNRNAYLVRLISGATIFPKDQLILLTQQYIIMNRLLRGISTNIKQIAKAVNAIGSTIKADLGNVIFLKKLILLYFLGQKET